MATGNTHIGYSTKRNQARTDLESPSLLKHSYRGQYAGYWGRNRNLFHKTIIPHAQQKRPIDSIVASLL